MCSSSATPLSLSRCDGAFQCWDEMFQINTRSHTLQCVCQRVTYPAVDWSSKWIHSVRELWTHKHREEDDEEEEGRIIEVFSNPRERDPWLFLNLKLTRWRSQPCVRYLKGTFCNFWHGALFLAYPVLFLLIETFSARCTQYSVSVACCFATCASASLLRQIQVFVE